MDGPAIGGSYGLCCKYMTRGLMVFFIEKAVTQFKQAAENPELA